MNYPTMFKRDLATDLVVPQLHENAGWLMEKPAQGQIFVAAVPDGITVRVDRISGTLVLSKWDGPNKQFTFMSREDKVNGPLYEAYDRTKPEPGVFIVYGPNINGNVHKAEYPRMIKINPVDNSLLHFGSTHGISFPYTPGVTIQDSYDSVRKALEEGNAPGALIIWEHPSMQTKEAVQIHRRDFGLPWPPPFTFGPCFKCGAKISTVKFNDKPMCRECDKLPLTPSQVN